ETDHAMPQTGKPPIEQSCQESSTESNDQPEAQHGAQPISVAQPFAQPTDEPNDCCADKSKHETIACRTANALIGDDTVAIVNGVTRYSLKESKQQRDAQPEAQPETQSDAQPEEQSNEDSIFDVSTLHEVLPLRLLGS